MARGSVLSKPEPLQYNPARLSDPLEKDTVLG
jgi:hypothetical protein